MLEMHLKELGIDYPHAGEEVGPGPYSMRITAPDDAREVRLSVDDGPWQPCRRENGHWWFDWSGDRPGEHVAVTRMIEDDGSLLIGQPRLFTVKPR